MADVDKLLQLQRLAQMHADRATADLNSALQPEKALQTAITELDSTPKFVPTSPEESQAAMRANAWRASKKRQLTMKLAERRAITQPIKEETARKVARASVLERLVTEQPKK